MNNISTIHHCYGCGVCATVCTKNIINISHNKDGFYEPRLTDIDKCTHCGLCLDVCAFNHEALSLKTNFKIESYAAWSNEEAVRRKCSSGGIGFEIGRALINEGYKVCGVRCNVDKECAEHYIASTVEELIFSVGSKYIQSYTLDGFKSINRKEKYLVTGVPCQIDSFRRYIQKFKVEDNFVLMDFFCHGVPSMHVWQKYLERVKKKVGRVTYVSWRDKLVGWHDSWVMKIDGENCSINTRWSQGDLFYKFFLSDGCLGKACYKNCKYKYQDSSADIRIGDMWGQQYKDCEDGVNCVVAFTEKGAKVLQSTNCIFIPYDFSTVAEGQLRQPVKYPYYYSILMQILRLPLDIRTCYFVFQLFRIKELIMIKLQKK